VSERDYGNLEALAIAVDRGSDRLREHLDAFEGGIADSGEITLGIRTMYEEAIADRAETIFSEYEGRGERPPSEVIRETRARQYVKREYPDLYTRYHALAASIKKGEKWLSQKRASMSALQTLNKTERELAGHVGPPNLHPVA
jgi:hypothetical protein